MAKPFINRRFKNNSTLKKIWGDEYSIAPKRGTVKPGSFFLSNNWDFNLAGYLFEKLSGIGIYDAVDSILAQPLTMEDWDKKINHKYMNTLK